MTNRKLAAIVKDQNPLTMSASETVQHACQRMWERRVGAVLVTGAKHCLVGIFTGRDAVRALAEGKDPAETTLAATMTPNPHTITPERTAIDALRAMSDGGYRHLPIVAEGKILGVVSRGDFQGLELDHLESEEHLWERIG
ncbi:MAG: CBS domain-containing protein [Burkholderiales bacterium]